jgi:hypothetical protein
MIVFAEGPELPMVETAAGNAQAGVVFQTSWTEGLLLAVMPKIAPRPPMVISRA